MKTGEDGGRPGARVRWRRAFTSGAADGRAEALEALLQLGGVMLANDEEPLSHVDFWFSYDLDWGVTSGYVPSDETCQPPRGVDD